MFVFTPELAPCKAYLTTSTVADDDGNVPLWEAIQGKHRSIAEVLWKQGARLTTGKEGDFLCRAAEIGGLDILEDLLKYDTDINAQNSDGSTALHIAVTTGNLEVANFLLDQGASTEICDARGLRPQDLAEQQKQEDMLKLFPTRESEETLNKEKLEEGIKDSEEDSQSEQIIISSDQDPEVKTHKKITINSVAPEFFSIPAVGKGKRLANGVTLKGARTEAKFDNSLARIVPSSSWNVERNFPGRKDLQDVPLRVTVHCHHPKGKHVRQLGKLINLPDTLEELLQLSSKYNKFDVHNDMYTCTELAFPLYISIVVAAFILFWLCFQGY